MIRREANQVQTQTTDQCGFVGLRRRLDVLGFEALQDEVVNGIPEPRAAVNLGDGRSSNGSKRPVGRFPFFGSQRGVNSFGWRPLGSLIDPGPDHADLFGRKRVPARGHGLGWVGAGDQLDQSALGTIPRQNHRTRFAASKRILRSIQSQTLHLLLGAMAKKAAAL